MPDYSSNESKWKAYQFSDPFASGKFIVCNKVSKTYCNPDCDSRPTTNLKSEIKFVDNQEEAIALGYNACEFCDPSAVSSISPHVLFECVASVNKSIGFVSPLVDNNDDKNNEKIKSDLIKRETNEGRRLSEPSGSFKSNYNKETIDVSKNDFDHYKLVDLACRHLALAAAATVFQNKCKKNVVSPQSDESNKDESSKKRKRRGGVLGFKELAAKSKLSAWHFHRVFKSVTGCTPKNYGDKCTAYLKSHKDVSINYSLSSRVSSSSLNSDKNSSPAISTDVTSPYRTPLSTVDDDYATITKRAKTESATDFGMDNFKSLSSMNNNNINNNNFIAAPSLQEFDFQPDLQLIHNTQQYLISPNSIDSGNDDFQLKGDQFQAIDSNQSNFIQDNAILDFAQTQKTNPQNLSEDFEVAKLDSPFGTNSDFTNTQSIGQELFNNEFLWNTGFSEEIKDYNNGFQAGTSDLPNESFNWIMTNGI